MPETPTVVLVDAYSSGRRLAPLLRERGLRCVHVRSTAVIPAVYAASFQPDDFAAEVVHRGDVAATLAEVSGHRPIALFAGIESGVELADRLSEGLGLRTNGTALSSARRDKHRMIETIRAAGLNAARQIRATDEDELLHWYAGIGGRIVVKPVRSAGNDGVHFCDGADEVRAAFRALHGTRSALDLHNDAVLAQEYLYGGEYYVNTVSLDGRHHVCDIWKTTHLNVNGVRDLLDSAYLLPRTGPVQDQLARYTYRVLDALGIGNGPAHTEVKLTPGGPCLIETGARVCGGDLPHLVRAAIGESQLELTVDAYTAPDRFRARCGTPYQVKRYASSIAMISPEAGTLKDYPRLDRLRELESFHELKIAVQPGDRIARTVNDFTYPMLVNLLHEVDEVVLRDYGTVRQIDGDGFYALA